VKACKHKGELQEGESPLVKLLIVYLQGESLEIWGLSALELAITVDVSGPSALRPYNPITLCPVLRSQSLTKANF